MTATRARRAILGYATELELDRFVVDAAGAGGWDLTYHTHDARYSPAGFPDRVLLHVRDRLTVFAELKGYDSRRRLGEPSVEQLAWLEGLRAAGQFAYLWTPDDAELIERVLVGRRLEHLPPLPAPTADALRRHARKAMRP